MYLNNKVSKPTLALTVLEFSIVILVFFTLIFSSIDFYLTYMTKSMIQGSLDEAVLEATSLANLGSHGTGRSEVNIEWEIQLVGTNSKSAQTKPSGQLPAECDPNSSSYDARYSCTPKLGDSNTAVSYTHLTLPTICSV